MRIALLTCLPDNFLVCWPPVRALSVFHGNLPQKIWGTYFPHGESTSWNFPAKIRNSLRPIPSFDMMSKFPGSDHSCRRRYVALLLAEEGIIRTRKTTYASVCKKVVRNNTEESNRSHATVNGGHATRRPTVKQRSWTFEAIWKNFEKSRWTVRRQYGRWSRDRRPTVKQRFWTFQAIRKFFEKSRWTVTRQWSEVTRPSADCQTTFFGRF